MGKHEHTGVAKTMYHFLWKGPNFNKRTKPQLAFLLTYMVLVCQHRSKKNIKFHISLKHNKDRWKTTLDDGIAAGHERATQTCKTDSSCAHFPLVSLHSYITEGMTINHSSQSMKIQATVQCTVFSLSTMIYIFPCHCSVAGALL